MANVGEGTRIAVVGASLGGLSAANVLVRLGATVDVFEAFPRGFELRGGALGSVDVALVAAIRGDDGAAAAKGSRAIRGHGHFYGDLWQYLFEGLPEGTVRFGADVDAIIGAETRTPQLRLKGDNAAREFDLIVGADGGKSTMRAYVTDMTPTYAGYTLWRGLCPRRGIAGPPSGRAEVGGAYYETLGFPCAGPPGTGELWNCGVYMATPEQDAGAPTRNRQVGDNAMRAVPGWFVPFVRELFGETNARFWETCARTGKVGDDSERVPRTNQHFFHNTYVFGVLSKVSPHPVWELAADRAVRARVALLGDAVHMASPRTGAGAFTAMVDAVVLGDALRRGASLDDGLRRYNDDVVRRGRELHAKSRRAAAHFVPAGWVPVSPASLIPPSKMPPPPLDATAVAERWADEPAGDDDVPPPTAHARALDEGRR